MFRPGFIGIPQTATRLHTYSVDSIVGSSSNAYTFTGASFGTADGTSLVVCIAYMWSNGTQPTINAMTIDGTGATIHQAKLASNASSFDSSIAIGSRATSSTSGTIGISANNGSVRARIDVWRLNKLTSGTVFNSNGSSNITPANAATTLNVPAAGIIIAGGATMSPTGDGSVPSITGVTQDANGVHGSINLYRWVYGSSEKMAAETGRTITSVLNATGISNAMVAASWS